MSDDSDERARMWALKAEAGLLAKDLLLIRGLYSAIETNDEAGSLAETKIREANIGIFDCYCIGCKKETSFINAAIDIRTSGGGLRHGNALSNPPSLFGLRAVCQRDLTVYTYAFQKIGSRLVKIGQNPSMGDISFGELKDIEKSLDPLDRRELGTAIGLFSHDAASGAFVYLRRVFERMIGRAQARYAARVGPIEGFERMRVDQKIAALKDELPERVVRNSAVFSILSVGIHELSDEQCKSLFPVVKAVIFQMLEQEEHKRKQEVAERDTDAAFQALLSGDLIASGSGDGAA